MPAHPMAMELTKHPGTLLPLPGANKFGIIIPTEPIHVKKQLPNVDWILDGGKTTIGLESTVIVLDDDGFELLRPGAISPVEIGKVVPKTKTSFAGRNQLHSPGMLKSHYCPGKPLYIKGEMDPKLNTREAGLISFGTTSEGEHFKKVEILSTTKNLNQAAVNLFSAMHKLEDSDVKFIIAEPVPEEGIGIAIMDRLRKAAYKYKPAKINK